MAARQDARGGPRRRDRRRRQSLWPHGVAPNRPSSSARTATRCLTAAGSTARSASSTAWRSRAASPKAARPSSASTWSRSRTRRAVISASWARACSAARTSRRKWRRPSAATARRLQSAIDEANLRGRPLARLDPARHVAFLEAHIEQGPRLETSGTKIGVVSAIVGIKTLRVTFHGEANHAGTTPMDYAPRRRRRRAGLRRRHSRQAARRRRTGFGLERRQRALCARRFQCGAGGSRT